MPGLKPHGLDQWLEELKLFTDWYCPAVGVDVDADAYAAAWKEVLEPVASDGLGPVTVLRDYHAENIMLVGEREGVGHFGLLDFQDALAGHPAYDLASVLEDARRDVPPAIEREMIDRYVGATGNGEEFERAYWALAAQRNTRILGVFTRLWKRDNKPHYSRFQPRMWGLLERDLEQPHRSLYATGSMRTSRLNSGAIRGSRPRDPDQASRCACAPRSRPKCRTRR